MLLRTLALVVVIGILASGCTPSENTEAPKNDATTSQEAGSDSK